MYKSVLIMYIQGDFPSMLIPFFFNDAVIQNLKMWVFSNFKNSINQNLNKFKITVEVNILLVNQHIKILII